MKENRLSIFVDSYDGSKDLWKNLFDVFDHFWPDCPYERFLVANNEHFDRENLTVVNTGDEVDWVTTTLIGLRAISTKYVWLFLDDYYLSKNIKNSDIEEILDYMDSNDTFFYRLSPCRASDISVERHTVNHNFVYAINLQAVIWNRERFIENLEMIHSKGLKSPWEFERYFINYFENSNRTDVIPGVVYDTRDIMGYRNAIIQGKWVRHVIKEYKKEYGMILDTGNRPFMSRSAEFFDYAKKKAHSFFGFKARRRIKKALSKLGLKFMTK